MRNQTIGRPKKDPVSQIATMLWLSSIKDATGIQSAAGLYRHIELDEPIPRARNKKACEDQIRSKKWEQYLRGRHTPGADLVSRIEEKYKGTSQYLSLELWKVSSERRPDLESLLMTLVTVRPNLIKHFDTSTQKQTENISLAIPRIIDALWRQGDLKALTALVSLARIAEITDNQNQYLDAAIAALHVLVFVMRDQPFHAVKEELFSYFHSLLIPTKPSQNRTGGNTRYDIETAIDTINNSIDAAIRIGLIKDNRRDAAKLMFFAWRKGFIREFQSTLLLSSDQENAEQIKTIAPLMTADLRKSHRSCTFYTARKLRLLTS